MHDLRDPLERHGGTAQHLGVESRQHCGVMVRFGSQADAVKASCLRKFLNHHIFLRRL
jgi:hypothetical protein